MSTIVLQEKVRIPTGIASRASFLRWARSDRFPDHGWYSWLNGELWVDNTMERMNHNQVKGIFAIVLGTIILAGRLGRYFHDRMLLVCPAVDLASEPDGMFVSFATLKSRRARLHEGGQSIEVDGVPDMVLEVVSQSSIQKDTEVLRELYAKAGIAEYWLVDASQESVQFDLLRLTRRGYLAVRPQDGWLKSTVFGKSFKLVQSTDPNGCPEFNLLHR
jgi:Uma2 family endonuclease